MNAKLPTGTLEKLWSDPRHWRAGLFYSCKKDPRFIVPKKNKWRGWTVNFGHASGGAALLISIVFITMPFFCLARAGRVNSWGWVATLAAIVGVTVVGCWRCASPRRHEESDDGNP